VYRSPPMRKLTANSLVGLVALTIPPVEGTSEKNPVTEFKSPQFKVRCTRCQRDITEFDLQRLSELINAYVVMPGIPGQE
jgi:hypothetical protein